MPVVERAHLPGMVLGPAELRTMDLCAGGLLLGRPKAQLPPATSTASTRADRRQDLNSVASRQRSKNASRVRFRIR